METKKADTKSPAKKWFLLPIGLGVLSVICFIIFFVGIFSVVDAPKNYQDLSPEGPSTIMVEKENNYEIFYEYYYTYNLNQNVSFTFTNQETGKVFHSQRPGGTHTYSRGVVRGVAIGTVHLPKGTYVVEHDYIPGGEEVTFALGETFNAGGILASILGMLIAIFALIAAIFSLIVILVKRSQSKTPPPNYVSAPYPPAGWGPYQNQAPPQPGYYPPQAPPNYSPGGGYPPQGPQPPTPPNTP